MHIAIGAVFFVLDYTYILAYKLPSAYLELVFFSTIFIYSLHRIIGIQKVNTADSSGRFSVIQRYLGPLKLLVILSFIGIVISLAFLSIKIWMLLIPVGIISLLYTIPVFKNGKRLRDFNYLKIVLIALVWSYISIIPLVYSGQLSTSLFLFCEKFIFMLAITLPFDIRDQEVDEASALKTFAISLGAYKTYLTCYLFLAVGVLVHCYNLFSIGETTFNEAIFLSGAVYLLTFGCIYWSRKKEHDYFFSGLIDGTLLLRGVVLYLLAAVYLH